MRAGSGAAVTADTALRGNLGGSSSNVSDESCHVFVQLVANMWVGGGWEVYNWRVIRVQSLLSLEMFAQLKEKRRGKKALCCVIPRRAVDNTVSA